MMYDVVESLVNQYHEVGDFENFRFELIRSMSIESPVKENEFLKMNGQEITDSLYDIILKTYKRKEEMISKQAHPVIVDVYEKQSATYENIVVPVSDGSRIFRVLTNLKKAYESGAQELVRSYEKTVVLATIDDNWKEHLRELDDLKQSVQNATYEQKDPLLIYKFESFELIQQMNDKSNREVVSTLMKGHIPVSDPGAVQRAQAPKRLDLSKFEANKRETPQYNDPSAAPGRQKVQPVRVEKKVGRNDPCPCGSGKKYKNCHGG
jgi:preprotein translocase subunit SecA